jgi:hypothetical protein
VKTVAKAALKAPSTKDRGDWYAEGDDKAAIAMPAPKV